jgi:hypothetical protein
MFIIANTLEINRLWHHLCVALDGKLWSCVAWVGRQELQKLTSRLDLSGSAGSEVSMFYVPLAWCRD